MRDMCTCILLNACINGFMYNQKSIGDWSGVCLYKLASESQRTFFFLGGNPHSNCFKFVNTYIT